MQIIIPDNINDGELKLLPEGVATVMLEKIILGKSKSNQPKATFKWVITEEMEGADEPVVGDTVLETYSLQPQALFNLAGVYKAATKEKLPQGDYDEAQFLELLENALAGSTWKVVLENKLPTDGSSTDPRTTIVKKTFVSK